MVDLERCPEPALRCGAAAAPHGSLRHPVGGRDPQEGDDEDADNSFGRRGFGPRWADVAPAQARCGVAPVAGEDLEILSRALGVTAATLTGWRDTFVAAGEASLATRPTDGCDLQVYAALFPRRAPPMRDRDWRWVWRAYWMSYRLSSLAHSRVGCSRALGASIFVPSPPATTGLCRAEGSLNEGEVRASAPFTLSRWADTPRLAEAGG